MFTKEQIMKIGVEKLADFVLSLSEKHPDIVKKRLEIILAVFDSDPNEVVPMIKEEIEDLECYIDCDDNECMYNNDPPSLADRINDIRINIMDDILPKAPKQAIELLLCLLDSHENTLGQLYGRDDEERKVFKEACTDLGTAYASISNSVKDTVKLVFNRFMNNSYGIYDNIICNFEDILEDRGLKQLKQKLLQSLNQTTVNQDSEKSKTIISGLKSVADCLNDVDTYVEVYNGILKNAKADSIESVKSTSFQKAFEFRDPHVALNFFKEIKEFKQAAKLVQQKIDTLDPHVSLDFFIEIQDFEQAAKLIHLKSANLNANNCYTLRSIADKLCELDPLAAILLYRKLIESNLISAKSIYYDEAAKDLAVCNRLASKVTDWKSYKNHHLYFEELEVQHRAKKKFWSEYTLAFKKEMGSDFLLPSIETHTKKKRKYR